jgi:hypothetical protein
MSRIARLFLIVIAIVGTVALFSTFSIRESLAQAHPALVRSVDEPGRVPYQYAIELSSNDSRCGGNPAHNCFVVFPAVPAGKRLVIQHVSATQFVDAGFDAAATVQSGSSGLHLEIPPGGYQLLGGTAKNFIFSQAVHGYVEAGDAPSMSIYTLGPGVNNSLNRYYFISGYLVNVLP